MQDAIQTYSAKAKQYRAEVLSGKRIACKQIVALCKQVESDFTDFDSDYYYDEGAAHLVCKIIECFRHIKGKLAASGQRIKLEPWQCNWICSLYGWKRKQDGLRRYRRATIILPRKQGKSLIAAALGIYHLIFDKEMGAEVYCGASSLFQAKEVFSAAQAMLTSAPELVAKTGTLVNAASIVVPSTNSKFLPVISRPKDGSNVSCAICDELHQMRDNSLYESFLTGTAAREQPLIIAISTAGFGTENPCKALQDEAEKVLNKAVEDDELFALIYTIDPDVDWRSESALIMANPGCNVSVTLEYLKAAQQVAINNPAKAASFKTKHLNITVAASNAFYSIEKWNGCEDKITLQDFLGEPCWMGFDLSSKLDLTAICTIFIRQIEGKSHYYVFSECFIPSESVQQNPVYTSWDARGLINVTEGNTIDYTALEALILSRASDYKVQEIGYDSWHSDFFVQSLKPKMPGATKFIDVPQRATHLSTPMKLIEELTYNRRIHHDSDPVLNYCVSNVIGKPFGNLIFPDKAKPENKIDGAVALMIAMSRASIAPPPSQPRQFLAQVW